MKKEIRIIQLSHLFLVVFIFMSCSKERIEPKEEKANYEQADEFFENNKPEEQEYEVTGEGDGPLIGKSGSKIWLSKNILMYPNGDSVDFPYTIKLIELYNVQDMIYSQMPSVSGNTLLTTHGEIKVTAYKDGTELVLRPDKVWQLEIPRSSPADDMTIYYGEQSNTIINWVNMYSLLFDTSNYGYTGYIKHLGWVSCAKDAIGTAHAIDYNFHSDSVNIGSLTTFVYLPAKEGLMRVYNTSSYPLPIGETMKVLSIGRIGEQLYGFSTEETVSETNQIEVTLTKSTETEIKNIISSF